MKLDRHGYVTIAPREACLIFKATPKGAEAAQEFMADPIRTAIVDDSHTESIRPSRPVCAWHATRTAK